ncbi:hypothetical protein ACTWPT_06760 [Nonomuraea sp. 3N208]|uniref:hypothetical protein n=1 Tax=Nonomuraea sp. 3N208 TaxID=3457421 RepID=UPI003FCC4587
MLSKEQHAEFLANAKKDLAAGVDIDVLTSRRRNRVLMTPASLAELRAVVRGGRLGI